MNFFDHQERARRRTALLVALFVMAVAAIIAGINLAVALSLGLMDTGWGALGRHTGLMMSVSLAALFLIGGATAFRMASLRSGGSAVARAMGAAPVMPDTSDPQLRRLRNVVEEIALASGVPAPQIFVMEKEPGINAFAAGYAPTDAVVAVTRGTLDHLSRDELQGVVAHEFSHIVNGDIRLNIRLMGVLFGILVIGVIGRFLLHGGYRARVRGGNRGGIALLGLAFFLLGYIGVFFGRLIKAAVSRQREFLADGAAVQFTRQPAGIAGALKKIAALSGGSRLRAADSEEVSHMLFANGLRTFVGLLATHPPLINRIRAIEPGFDPEEIDTLRKRMARQKDKASGSPPPAGPANAHPGPITPPGQRSIPFPGAITRAAVTHAVLADLDQPDPVRLAHAAALRDTLPRSLYDAAHDSDAVVPLLLVLLLGDDAAMRRRRLDFLGGRISADGLGRVETLAPLAEGLDPRQRLPLMDLALPALRQRSPESLKALMPPVAELIRMDGRVSVFEYALGCLLARHVADFLDPGRARPGGHARLKDCGNAVVDLIAVLALHGHGDAAAARAAFSAGIATLYASRFAPDYRPPENWVKALDAALGRLDALALPVKQELIQGIVVTIAYDGTVTVAEAELLRAICGCLHVPLPPIQPPAKAAGAH
jgi:Zn-dependent protease with chaperone function